MNTEIRFSALYPRQAFLLVLVISPLMYGGIWVGFGAIGLMEYALVFSVCFAVLLFWTQQEFVVADGEIRAGKHQLLHLKHVDSVGF